MEIASLPVDNIQYQNGVTHFKLGKVSIFGYVWKVCIIYTIRMWVYSLNNAQALYQSAIFA